MPGFDNDCAFFGHGIDTRGIDPIVAPVVNQMDADGKLLIGAAAFPYIRAANMTATVGQGISITNGPGTINLAGIDATTAVKGVLPLATNAEAIAGADSTKAIVSTSMKAKLGVQTLHGLPIGASDSVAISWTAEPANGQLLIGKTGNPPTLAGLTPGPGIAITNGAGSITVGAWGGGLSWSTKGASTPLVINNGFISNAGAGLSFALPALSSVGDVVALTLDGSTSWTITQAANQQIRFGSAQTTLGAGGSLASTAQGDTVYLVCSVANLKWNVISSIGNITVV